MIKGILFDKDGTLIEFEKTWFSIMTLVFKKIEDQGLMTSDEIKLIKERSGILRNGFSKESKIQYMPTSEIVNQWSMWVIRQPVSFFKDRLYQIINESSLDESVEIKLLPKTMETIAYLSDKYRIGIATADTKDSMLHSLSHSGLLGYFHYFGSDDGVCKGKPDPMMAEEFCRTIGVRMDEILIVGDSVSDYEFALNAGCHFAGIDNEYGSLKDYLRMMNQSAVMVENLEELVKCFDL